MIRPGIIGVRLDAIVLIFAEISERPRCGVVREVGTAIMALCLLASGIAVVSVITRYVVARG